MAIAALVWRVLALVVLGFALANAATTTKPTLRPSAKPTARPTRLPTYYPTSHPTSRPSSRPTSRPTRKPTKRPPTLLSSHGPEKPSTAVVAGVVIGVIAGVGIGVGAYMNSKKRAAERMLQGDLKGDHIILVDAAGEGETRNPILEIDAHNNANRVKATHDVDAESHSSTASAPLMSGGGSTASSTANLQHLELATHDHAVIDDAKPWGKPVETPDLSPIKTPRAGADGFDDWDVVDTIL